MCNLSEIQIRTICLFAKSKGIDGATLTAIVKELKDYKRIYERLRSL